MSSSKVFAIVDAYSSGLELARELKVRGHTCLMVQSAAEIPAMYRSTFQSDHFDEVISYQGDLQETCSILRSANVSFLVAGCEMGVSLADTLSETLGLNSNGTGCSEARRNKALMGQVLRANGVRTPDAFSSFRLADALRWLRQRNQWPVVVKPLGSSGSDGVQRCETTTEFESAFSAILGGNNVFGNQNEAVLVQEFLSGTEYAVDTVSCAGTHRLAALWRYHHNQQHGKSLGSDALELLPYDSGLHSRLMPYVAQVLDALQIAHGPAHTEVVMTDRHPVLVEVGARLHGGNNPSLSRFCGGQSQIELMIGACVDPTRFLAEAEEPYQMCKHAMRVFLMPGRTGQWNSTPSLDQIRQLDSFFQLRCGVKAGQNVSRIVGWVVLVHSNREVMLRDYQRIRQLETSDLYSIQP